MRVVCVCMMPWISFSHECAPLVVVGCVRTRKLDEIQAKERTMATHTFGDFVEEDYGAITTIELIYGSHARLQQTFLEEEDCVFQWDRFLSWKDFERLQLSFQKMTKDNVVLFALREQEAARSSAGSFVMHKMIPQTTIPDDCRMAFADEERALSLGLEALLLMRTKDLFGRALVKTLKNKNVRVGNSSDDEWFVVAVLLGATPPVFVPVHAASVGSTVATAPAVSTAAAVPVAMGYSADSGRYISNSDYSSGGYHHSNGGGGRGICYAFQKGECTRGDSCRYEHTTGTFVSLPLCVRVPGHF